MKPVSTLVGVAGLVGSGLSSISLSLEMVTSLSASWAADETCSSQSFLLVFFKWANFGLVAN